MSLADPAGSAGDSDRPRCPSDVHAARRSWCPLDRSGALTIAFTRRKACPSAACGEPIRPFSHAGLEVAEPERSATSATTSSPRAAGPISTTSTPRPRSGARRPAPQAFLVGASHRRSATDRAHQQHRVAQRLDHAVAAVREHTVARRQAAAPSAWARKVLPTPTGPTWPTWAWVSRPAPSRCRGQARDKVRSGPWKGRPVWSRQSSRYQPRG